MFERKLLCPLYVAKDGPCMKKKNGNMYVNNKFDCPYA